MILPLSWLKDYVEIDVTPEELEKKLFDAGFEVEEKYELGKDINKVVAGYVEKCEPIPDTHLSVCQVNAGEQGTFQVCCGADNVKEGGKFPLALVGATVYATAKDHKTVEGVATIKKGKLRGFESFGMLCSGVELGLTEDLYPGAGYNGLLVLPEDAKPGEDVKPMLGLDDWIFDIACKQTGLPEHFRYGQRGCCCARERIKNAFHRLHRDGGKERRFYRFRGSPGFMSPLFGPLCL